jgi:hypothetical protein
MLIAAHDDARYKQTVKRRGASMSDDLEQYRQQRRWHKVPQPGRSVSRHATGKAPVFVIKRQWLLVKMCDAEAGVRCHPVSTQDRSVLSNRCTGEISREEDASDD